MLINIDGENYTEMELRVALIEYKKLQGFIRDNKKQAELQKKKLNAFYHLKNVVDNKELLKFLMAILPFKEIDTVLEEYNVKIK